MKNAYLKGLIFFLGLGFSVGAKSQVVDEVINRYISAIGGAEKWRQIKSVRIEGIVALKDEVSGKPTGAEFPLVLEAVHYTGARTVLKVLGLEFVDLLTPDGNWLLDPSSGDTTFRKASDGEFLSKVDNLDVQDLFIDYANKGAKVELLSNVTENNIEYYRIKMTTRYKSIREYYINKKTSLVDKYIATEGNDSATKKDVVYNLFNYRTGPNGLKIAYGSDNGKMILTTTKIIFNPRIDESIFQIK